MLGTSALEDQLTPLLPAKESKGVKLGQGLTGPAIADASQTADFLGEIGLLRVFSQKAQCPLQIGGHEDISYHGHILHWSEHTFTILNIEGV